MPTKKGASKGKTTKSKGKQMVPPPSVQKLQHIREVFSSYDKNNDRSITVDELKEALDALGKPHSDKDIDKLMKAVDTDRSGFITLNEFILLAQYDDAKKKPTGVTDEELHWAFQRFDRNNDGYIDKNELTFILTNCGQKMSKEEVNDMMTGLDSNKDGRICYEEFIQIWTIK